MNEINITSAQYAIDKATNQNTSIVATIDGTEMIIPLAPGNRHYDEIMKQQSEGLLTIADAE